MNRKVLISSQCDAIRMTESMHGHLGMGGRVHDGGRVSVSIKSVIHAARLIKL